MEPDFRGLWKDNRDRLIRILYWDMDRLCWIGIISPELDEIQFDVNGISRNGTSKLMTRFRGGENL